MPYSVFYNDPIEKEYIISHGDSNTPLFAPGELCKIENYELAKADGFTGWVIHHRLGISPDGTPGKLRRVLVSENLYYSRPANELLFLTASEHIKLHYRAMAKKRHNTYIGTHEQTSPRRTREGTTMSKLTRMKMSATKIKANDTENRFKLVLASIERGDTLCFRDYAFYRRYCLRNGLEFKGCKVDKSSKISTVDFEKPIVSKDEKQKLFLKQVHRYREILAVIKSGKFISHNDASFLCRFCASVDWAIPTFKIDWKI